MTRPARPRGQRDMVVGGVDPESRGIPQAPGLSGGVIVNKLAGQPGRFVRAVAGGPAAPLGVGSRHFWTAVTTGVEGFDMQI